MHVMPKGILLFVTGCVMHEFITVRKVMSLVSNVQLKLPEGGLSLTACEMLSLFRNLPIALGSFIPEGVKHWALFIQLQHIVDIAYAPVQTDAMLNYFEGFHEEHMLLFKELYPQVTIKPKQNILIHLKTVVKENGLMRHLSCLKYERIGFFKRLGHVVCNFKNI